jgi:hypothetical protein
VFVFVYFVFPYWVPCHMVSLKHHSQRFPKNDFTPESCEAIKHAEMACNTNPPSPINTCQIWYEVTAYSVRKEFQTVAPFQFHILVGGHRCRNTDEKRVNFPAYLMHIVPTLYPVRTCINCALEEDMYI